MIYWYFENLVYFTKYMKVYELFAEYNSCCTHPCFPCFCMLSEFAAEDFVVLRGVGWTSGWDATREPFSLIIVNNLVK